MAESIITIDSAIVTKNASEYFTFKSGFTPSDCNVWQVAPHIGFFNIDMSKSLSAGETAIGNTTTKVRGVNYVAGRCSTSSGTFPATGVVIGNGGAIRVHTHAAATAFVISGMILLT